MSCSILAIFVRRETHTEYLEWVRMSDYEVQPFCLFLMHKDFQTYLLIILTNFAIPLFSNWAFAARCTKAYRNGVVITVCKGCMSKHLIADNLGWTKYIGGFDGDANIEEFMETLGRGDEVNRVTKEVFELEEVLHHKNSQMMSDDQFSNRDDRNSFE